MPFHPMGCNSRERKSRPVRPGVVERLARGADDPESSTVLASPGIAHILTVRHRTVNFRAHSPAPPRSPRHQTRPRARLLAPRANFHHPTRPAMATQLLLGTIVLLLLACIALLLVLLRRPGRADPQGIEARLARVSRGRSAPSGPCARRSPARARRRGAAATCSGARSARRSRRSTTACSSTWASIALSDVPTSPGSRRSPPPRASGDSSARPARRAPASLTRAGAECPAVRPGRAQAAPAAARCRRGGGHDGAEEARRGRRVREDDGSRRVGEETGAWTGVMTRRSWWSGECARKLTVRCLTVQNARRYRVKPGRSTTRDRPRRGPGVHHPWTNGAGFPLQDCSPSGGTASSRTPPATRSPLRPLLRSPDHHPV